MMMGLIIWGLFWIGAFGLLASALWIALRAVKALEGRQRAGQDVAELQLRVDQLETLTAQQSRELSQLRASHDFTSRLLERSDNPRGTA